MQKVSSLTSTKTGNKSFLIIDATVVENVNIGVSEYLRAPNLDNLSLSVAAGEFIVIVGPSGCGKSTLVRIISTLLLPDHGEARVFGKDVVRDAHEVKRLISRVSVEPSFFKKLSAMENLIFTAQTYGITKSAAVPTILSILDRLGIDSKRARRPLEQMSRGMQQKVAIARAFMTSPVLLLLDEPTTGLDPGSKIDVQEFIREVRNSHDATILLMSHDMTNTQNQKIDFHQICHLGFCNQSIPSRFAISYPHRLPHEGIASERRNAPL